jgi:hypothetical protein
MEWEDGSISVYYTLPDMDTHFVVYDTLVNPTERNLLVNEPADVEDDTFVKGMQIP